MARARAGSQRQYNVVQDCIDIAGGVKAFYSTQMRPVQVDNAGVTHCYYVRFAGEDAWLEANKAADLGEGILTKPVSVAQMHAWAAEALKKDARCFFAGMK